ncbi:hypothetical protein HFO58_10980 [Rhizobium leguminosarum]|uniref:hypothetical protein n=1 Tax=Rhizobium leguminosarum TaxID=384 RepID=UPI001C9721CB|nr:hypothetical protein [Rhizobium leguminosarum]MBY5533681.1 hypothetical protein [Rhizobium leguminosarum]
MWVLATLLTEGAILRIVTALGAASVAIFIGSALLVPRKHNARTACNIVFLRGFKQEARADVPNRVLPCIGCYGRVMWLGNIVSHTKIDRIGQILTDARYQKIYGETWPIEVIKFIEEADLAVIDFSVLSDSLLWEIGQCINRLPIERIVLIVELSRSSRDNYAELLSVYPQLWSTSYKIPVYPSRFFMPLNILKWWFFAFEGRVNVCMRQIAADATKPPVPLISVRGEGR